MNSKVDPLRQSFSILPKIATKFDVQDKIIPNGNKIIELSDQNKRENNLRQVQEIRPLDTVSLSANRSKDL